MEREALIKQWRAEEEIAYIHGWDFSHIADRSREQTDFPWNYRKTILEHLSPEKKLLDTDTGGGEFLLSLGHPYKNTAATEGYAPNIAVCSQTLTPLGIDFRPGVIADGLNFPDESFDLIINRHGDLNPGEFYRLLKPGGIFITQQVGAENDQAFIRLLCGQAPLPFPAQFAGIAKTNFENQGFQVIQAQECHRPYDFYDVAALVWFARILPWEFPGFSVETHLDNLFNAQELLERDGYIRGFTHRFFLVAQK